MGMAIIRPDIHSLNCHGLRGSVLGKASGWLLMLDFRHTPLLLFSVSFLDGGFLVAARRGLYYIRFKVLYILEILDLRVLPTGKTYGILFDAETTVLS